MHEEVHELQLFEALDCSGAPIGVTGPVEAQVRSRVIHCKREEHILSSTCGCLVLL